MEWETPYWNNHEESKDAWKILKHHTEVASSRIYEELPEILQRSFDEGVAYAREQIAREDEKAGDSYLCRHVPHRAGMEYCDYCSGVQDGFYLAAAIARGEK